MYNIPEEPILDCVMRTGYPPWNQPEDVTRCERCDCIIPEDENIYYDCSYDTLCKECLLETHSY